MNLQIFRTIFGANDASVVAAKLKEETDLYSAKLDFEIPFFI